MEPTIDHGQIRQRVRARSKSLLGTQFRAEVVTCIALGEEPFWARSMSGQLAIPENKISAELSRFADENLLVPMSSETWDRRKLYQVSNAAKQTAYWAAGVDIVELAVRDVAGADHDADAAFTRFLAGMGLRRKDPRANELRT